MCIMVDKGTRVLVQGISGSAGAFHARQMIEYGTQVVAGVSPGLGGQKLDDRVPIFDTVERAVRATGANASVVFVPPQFAADSLLEAADAEVPLVICITEGIPVGEMLKAKALIAATSHTRLLGPNCPGIISPSARCKLGIMPGHIHRPGRIGIVSRNSALTYEAVFQLGRLGLGESTVVGLGGDPVTGTSFIDVLKMFDADPDTDAVIMIGEAAGKAEEEAAVFAAGGFHKPLTAFIADAPSHAHGEGGPSLAAEKIKAMEAAGIVMAPSVADLGSALQRAVERGLPSRR
ncbi:MAG: succinate--CoA ligase subunit alpha [Archangiaceae bacterium]|nr:succinate--CoA ligase subunit alpha [Archangiaceae bacterium]